MTTIDTAVLENDNINTVALNGSTIIKPVLTPIDSKTKKLKATLHKIERNSYFGIKRVFDVLCSLLGIMILLPVAIVTKICYVATGDKKSIFYKQRRIGKNGKPNHVGIVEKTENGYIYTIEGNSTDDGCRAKKYSINSNVIFGFGLPAY